MWYIIVRNTQKPKDVFQCKFFNNAPQPKIIHNANQEEWIWDLKNNRPVEPEDYIPSWYNSEPFVEISSSASWTDVEKWGMEIFSNNEKLDDQLLKEIDAIKTKYNQKAERIMAAVRFVQKQIRYLGIEIGINSHKPNSPNKVYFQRYGDCKDKSLLLCKMLQMMEIEAYPALINTWMSDEITNRLPSGRIFDHVVVKVYMDGFAYWFDPTKSNQGGDISHYSFPNFRHSLVLDGKFNELDGIPVFNNSKIDIKEKITVEDFGGKAKLQVNTTYNGSDADIIRYTLTNNIKEVQKNYLKFYKNSYDSINVDKPFCFEDDTVYNIIVTHENYRIADFWKNDNNILSSSLYSYNINEKLKPYKSLGGSRKSPLYLDFPINIHHYIEITFLKNWSITPYNEVIKNGCFVFNSSVRCNRNVCYLDYELKTLTNNVPTEKTKDFIRDIKLISEKYNGMEFTYNETETKKKFSIGLFAFFLFIIGVLTTLMIWIYKKRQPMETEGIFYPKLGGWMILPILGLSLTPLIAIYTLFNGNHFDVGFFHLYTSNDSSAYHFLWGSYWIISIVCQAAYIVTPILILTMIFKYERRAPVFAMWFYVGNFGANMIILLLASGIANIETGAVSEIGQNLTKAFFACAIWIPYFHFSKRVKSTFIK